MVPERNLLAPFAQHVFAMSGKKKDFMNVCHVFAFNMYTGNYNLNPQRNQLTKLCGEYDKKRSNIHGSIQAICDCYLLLHLHPAADA